MLTLRLDVPVLTGLRLDHAAVARQVGLVVAQAVRAQLRRGVQMDGRAMERGADAGAPLRDSGRLIRDVRYDRRSQSVQPSTRPRSDLAGRARRRVTSSYGLLRVHLAGRRVGQPDVGDPLGTVSYWPTQAVPLVQQAVADVGRLRLVSRGRRRVSR